MSNPEFDLYVADKLRRKADDAKQRGIEFNMTFQSMKNILSAKKCYYTGFPIKRAKHGQSYAQPDDLTIDRIDCTKGYVKGNVVACSHAANQLKAQVEKAGVPGFNMGIKVMKKAIKRIEG